MIILRNAPRANRTHGSNGGGRVCGGHGVILYALHCGGGGGGSSNVRHVIIIYKRGRGRWKKNEENNRGIKNY